MTRDHVVTFNAGSSSLRCGIYRIGADDPLPVERIGIGGLPHRMTLKTDAGEETLPAPPEGRAHETAFDTMLERVKDRVDLSRVRYFSHRVVHGGRDYRKPVRVDDTVLTRLAALAPLAPSHQPHNLRPIRHLRDVCPDVPQIACFDTAFHRTQPRMSEIFGLPREITGQGLIRYGFHGLSYEYISRHLSRTMPALAMGRVIVAHLGHGASMCAIQGGRSIATTMGATALDGLPMGTRCGAIDPGIVLHLITEMDHRPEDVLKMLYERSGLLGISGLSGEMTELLNSDTDGAREAVSFFVYRCQREIGSLVAALGGLDGLVFTGGIGENSAVLRERICTGLSWLGLKLDADANSGHETVISTSDSAGRILAVPTDEERILALAGQEI